VIEAVIPQTQLRGFVLVKREGEGSKKLAVKPDFHPMFLTQCQIVKQDGFIRQSTFDLTIINLNGVFTTATLRIYSRFFALLKAHRTDTHLACFSDTGRCKDQNKEG
jgi:hypothetical protein